MGVGGECAPACIEQGCAFQHAMGRGCVYPSMQWGRGGCMPLGPGEEVLAFRSGGGGCIPLHGRHPHGHPQAATPLGRQLPLLADTTLRADPKADTPFP